MSAASAACIRALYARSRRELGWFSLRRASAMEDAADSNRRVSSFAVTLCAFSLPMAARFFNVIEMSDQQDLGAFNNAEQKSLLARELGAKFGRTVYMRID